MTLPLDTFIPEGLDGPLATVDELDPLPLTKGEHDLINRLLLKLRRDQKTLSKWDTYYEGVQHLANLGISIPPELREFVVVVNWPRVVADSLEQRIDLEGFRLPGQLKRDEKLWRIWQANNMDEESQTAHLDAIVFGRSYVCVGTNEDDPTTPLVTIESPMEMTAEVSPRTRKVTAALRLYRDHDEEGRILDRATLSLPDETIWAVKRWAGPTRGWTEEDRDAHNLGVVPVVPLVNRPRTTDRSGVSELADVIGLTDAAARALTLAQLATETLSVPQRAVLGASASDFQDKDGNVLPVWEAYFGAVWALDSVPALLGDEDDPTGFEPRHALLREAYRRWPHWRAPRSARVMEALVPAILEQKVTSTEARQAWRDLLRWYGEPAPGPAPAGLRVPPSPEQWLRVPSWDWHRAGVDAKRSRAVLAACQVAAKLEATALRPAGSPGALQVAERALRTVVGIGVWTAAETMQRAHGHADAPSVGDLHVPGLVGHALIGQKVDDDGMLELLEPYAGHRQRAVRLVELAAGAGLVRVRRRAPRYAPRDFRRI